MIDNHDLQPATGPWPFPLPHSSMPGGLLEPELIARMANQLFAESPSVDPASESMAASMLGGNLDPQHFDEEGLRQGADKSRISQPSAPGSGMPAADHEQFMLDPASLTADLESHLHSLMLGAPPPDTPGISQGTDVGSAMTLPTDPLAMQALLHETALPDLGLAGDPGAANGGLVGYRPQMPTSPRYYFLQDPVIPSGASIVSGGFDVEAVRRDFPILHQKVHGKPLIWMDSAATSQKPQAVIDAIAHFYQHDNSNVHRGAHALAARATNAYEDAREKVRRFIGAGSASECVFVRGATEAINLVAQSYGGAVLAPGDEIVLTQFEHHANIVPWQLIAQKTGAVIKVAPIDDRGEIILEEYEKLLGPKTKIVGISHASNVLGTVPPVKKMIEMAHRHGARVLVDGAQSVPHFRVNVQDLNADFYVFSSHKLFGPTGVGVLYAKRELLDQMPPWQGGGNMINDVTFEQTTYNEPPYKFEAGTGLLAAAVGLGAAIDYLEKIGFEAAGRYEHALLQYAIKGLSAIPGLRLIGTSPEKVGVISFVLDGIKTEDVGSYLDREGIAVRSGHHCAQPTMQRYGVTGTVRPSLAFYNTCDEVDTLVAAVARARVELPSSGPR